MRAIIVGGGIVGCAVARELARHDVDVVVLERGSPGSATTAHGEGNILVSDKGPGPELDLARLSRRMWPGALAEMAEEPAVDVASVEWDPKGGIVVATTDGGCSVLNDFAQSQQQVGVAADAMSSDEIRTAEPFLTPEITASYFYREDAQVQPVAAARAFLASAVAAGARVHSATPVIAPLMSGGTLIGVETPESKFFGDVVVNCAGPWSGQVSAVLGAPISIMPRRGDVLITTAMPPTVFHKVYDADYVGAVGSGSAELHTSAVVESTAAGPLLIGSSRRQVQFDNRIRIDSLQEIARKALRLFPVLASVQTMRAYGGFRPFVADHLPVIGADSRLPGLWHATGHEGAGIGLSIGTAHLIRAGLLGDVPLVSPDAFRVDRPAVTESMSGASS